MAPKGVKRKMSCSLRVRGGREPNDCDENYEWFTFKELTNMYGRIHAFFVHGNENIPTRVRKCVDVLEYGILKNVYADDWPPKFEHEDRRGKGMQIARSAQRHEQHK